MPIILSICGDPGGAAALAPVLTALHKIEDLEIVNFAYSHARGVLGKRNISYRALTDETSREEVKRCFDEVQPDALFTATSLNGINLEHLFIDEALERGIYSLAVMDFWSNYRARFESAKKTFHLPDEIAVMDDFAAQEMEKQGFVKDRLIVTGQPALDDLVADRSSDRKELATHLRSDIGVTAETLVVAFVSQPPIGEWGADENHPKYPGFSKSTVLPMLINALEQISKDSKRSVALVIRPHPREKEDDFSWVASEKIKVLVHREGNSRKFVQACDLVTGMNSVLLLEASLLGCTVLSLQPGARFDDCLPSTRMGLSGCARKPEDVQPMLRAFLLDEATRSSYRSRCENVVLPVDATDRVVAHLSKQLKTRQHSLS
ncbi:MAG: hypothetical protein ABI443_00160 [Chthoniobacterales bacterium]